MDADFYTRLAPWAKAVTGAVFLVNAGPPVTILAPVAAGFQRWIMSWTIADQSVGQVHLINLRTVGGVVLSGMGSWVPGTSIVVNRLIQNSADTELQLQDMSAGVDLTHLFCVHYADTPPNVLSNTVVGQVAG